MSQWMSIGFDPDRMDPVSTSSAPAAIDGLDQVTPSEAGAGDGLNGSRKHSITGAFKRLVARHRKPALPV